MAATGLMHAVLSRRASGKPKSFRTQRDRPSPLPCFVLRIASRGKIWRLGKARRIRSASYALSPSTLSGRQRGRPRGPWSSGMRSSKGRAWVENVTVGCREFDCQRNAVTIANQTALATPLSPISRDLAQSAAPKNCAHRIAVDDSTRPVDLTITRKPVQQCGMDEIPNSILLPVAQPPPAGHAGAATQSFFGSIPQGIPLRSTKIMPARQAQSVRRGRPRRGLGKGIGRIGSIKPHQE